MVVPLVVTVVVRPGTTLASEATSVTPWFCNCSAEAATIVSPTSESACWRFCAVTTISCNAPGPASGALAAGAAAASATSAFGSARSWLDQSTQTVNIIGQTRQIA